MARPESEILLLYQLDQVAASIVEDGDRDLSSHERGQPKAHALPAQACILGVDIIDEERQRRNPLTNIRLLELSHRLSSDRF